MPPLLKKIHLLIILLSIFIQPIIYSQNKLTGNWKYVFAGGEMTIQITSTNIIIDGISYPYKIENNNLLVLDENRYTSYPYAQSGNQLSLSFPDGSKITFTRETGTAAPTDPLSRIIQKPGTGKPSESSLIGRWLFQSPEGQIVLEFLSPNQLALNGTTTQYQLKEGIIQAMGDYGWEDYPYTLTNDNLIITFPGGTKIPFSKTAGFAQAQPGMSNQQTGGGASWQLRGTLCSWSGSSGGVSSYSSSDRINFDGQGNFTFGRESSFSSDAGLAYGNNPNRQHGTYRVEDRFVILIFQSGETYRVNINMRQDNGMITELMYNDKLYATGLCD
jgi:hypothetical protein